MDIVFSLDESGRANFLQAMMHSFNCTYISVWSYLPQPSNCLLNLDGLYWENDTKPSSSSSSSSSRGFDRRLFNEYRKLIINVENNFVPGHAFKNNVSYLELQESDLQTHASAQVQRQFYIAARIKSSVFMGSSDGEIELGFSNISQVNMGEKMKQTFPTLQASTMEVEPPTQNHPQFQNPNLTSFSSSMKSLSMGSPESSSFFYNFSQSASLPIPMQAKPTSHSAALIPLLIPPSSSSSSSSSRHRESSKASAFKKYALTIKPQNHQRQNQSMLKRLIIFYRSLNLMRIQERIQANRSTPTATQLLHMLSERKRREKLNESFQALKTLLPPGTKKGKASILETTREHITKLKAQISELLQKNHLLEAHISASKQRNKDEAIPSTSSSSINESFNIIRVSLSHIVPESTSSQEQGRVIDLEINVRFEGSLMADLAVRVLEFLKKITNIRVLSINAESKNLQSSSLIRLSFRLSIQESEWEWDASTFQEAVRRVVSNLAPR